MILSFFQETFALHFGSVLDWNGSLEILLARDRARGPAQSNHDCWDPTVYPKKYAHVFCFAVLCCGYTLTDFPISIRLTSLALWQSNDCPSASKATLMNMDKYFMWIHYERLHNHNKAKHNKTVCIFLGIYCSSSPWYQQLWCWYKSHRIHRHQHGSLTWASLCLQLP